MSQLAETQRRLWRLLTAPSGARAALAEAGDAAGASLEGWLRADPPPAPALRLEVYANAYFGRIHGVMAEDFGALAAALGDVGFHDLVTAYLCVHPPDRPSLRHVGERLPGFLASHDAAGPFRRRWPWAADLARLEVALADAFDAPDAASLAREDLAELPPERWGGLALALHPSAELVRVDGAAIGLRRCFEIGETLDPPETTDGPSTLLVWRQHERVHFREPDAEEAALLDAVARGIAFGALCDRLARRHGAEAAPARAAGWLATWVDAGLLVLLP